MHTNNDYMIIITASVIAAILTIILSILKLVPDNGLGVLLGSVLYLMIYCTLHSQFKKK